MAKNSTLHYSLHNLASQIQHDIISCDDFAVESDYKDVFQTLNMAPVFDVRQEIVDNILNFAEKYY